MNLKEPRNNLDIEIQKRMESSVWDLSMAEKITSGIRQKKKRFIAASMSSLAAAAVIIIAVFLNSDGKTAGEYEQLIQTQLNGIYSEVFNEKYISTYSSGQDETAIYDNIDLLIDNTLSKR